MNERIGMEESKKERRKDKEENKVTRKQKIEQTEVQMYEQMDYWTHPSLSFSAIAAPQGHHPKGLANLSITSKVKRCIWLFKNEDYGNGDAFYLF